MTRELVLDALEKAYKRRKPEPGLIHHSDRGHNMLVMSTVKSYKPTR